MAKNAKTKKNKQAEDVRIPTWRDYILPAQLKFEQRRVLVGDAYSIVYTIFNYPSSAGIAWLRPIMLMENTIVSINVDEGNTKQLLDSINFTINNERAKREESSNKKLEVDKIQASEDKIVKAMELSSRIVAENAKVVECTIYIQVFADSPEELAKKCTEIEGKLSGRYFIPRVIKWKQEEGFNSLLPISMNQYRQYTSNPMTSDVFFGGLAMFPTNGINEPTGNYVGYDDSNNPIFLDIWSKKYNKSNSNATILGKSGSGKSATIKQLLVGELSRRDKNTKIIMIDAEKEYIPIANHYGGNVIDAAGESGYMINPLQFRDIPEALDDLSSAEIQRLSLRGDFKGAMSTHITYLKEWFRIYQPELTQAHLALIESCLYELYGKFGFTEASSPADIPNSAFPTLSDLGDVIKERFDNEEDEQRETLYNEILLYLNSALIGCDRFLFNGHTNVDLSNAFNVFNVSKLLGISENIKAAALNNITSFVWLAMTKDKNERVMFVVDEAHLFISKENTQMLSFLGNLAKRARKYTGSLIVATQNIIDFTAPEIAKQGEGVLSNSATKILMHIGENDLKEAVRLFALNEGEENLLRNAQIGTGLICAGNMKVFANVEIEPSVLNLAQQGGGK